MPLTKKQQEQFNRMRSALLAIAKGYQTPKQLRKESQSEWGLDYEEALEMSYENIQGLAKTAIKGTKHIDLLQTPTKK